LTGEASFTNGRTAERFIVEVRTPDQGLEIRDRQDGLMLARWAYPDIRPVVSSAPARPRSKRLRLTCRTDPDARLTLADAELIDRLRQRVPALAKRRRRLPRLWAWAAGVVGVVLGAWLLYEALDWAPRPLARLMPRSWEVALGSGMAQPLATSLGGVCQTPAGRAALDTLLNRLTANQPLPFPPTVEVVKAPQINAFALPGGRIILLNGLLKEAHSADEVAFVLAHELSHVALRHVAEQVIRRVGLAWAVLAVTGEPTGLAAGTVAGLLRMSYSREAESEADAMAVHLLQDADISLSGMDDFVRRMEQRESHAGALPPFLSDHPATANRVPPPVLQPFARPALPDEAWHALRTICD
jgi:beta-barrel assembly-enhancing protease